MVNFSVMSCLFCRFTFNKYENTTCIALVVFSSVHILFNIALLNIPALPKLSTRSAQLWVLHWLRVHVIGSSYICTSIYFITLIDRHHDTITRPKSRPQ